MPRVVLRLSSAKRARLLAAHVTTYSKLLELINTTAMQQKALSSVCVMVSVVKCTGCCCLHSVVANLDRDRGDLHVGLHDGRLLQQVGNLLVVSGIC